MKFIKPWKTNLEIGCLLIEIMNSDGRCLNNVVWISNGATRFYNTFNGWIGVKNQGFDIRIGK